MDSVVVASEFFVVKEGALFRRYADTAFLEYCAIRITISPARAAAYVL